MNGEIWFQLPPQDRLDWSITVFAAFIITFGGLYLLLDIARYRVDKVTTLKRRLGFEQVNNGVFMTISLIWLTLLVTFVFATIVSVTSAVFELATLDAGAETALRGRMLSLTAMIAGLAAVAAFPITLIRMHHAARQTMVAEEKLFNEKLHEASKDLAAWREVTRVVGEKGGEHVLTTREPDLVTRATAIDHLYGLIQERPSEASRIAAILSLYVREHTVQVGDKIPDAPPVPVPENATPDELLEWARGLKVARPDLQKAVQTLGRIRNIPKVELEDNAIDLRGANLQAMDLSDLNFGKGQWQWAQMQGANLWRTQMQGTILTETQMQGAELSSAQMQGAILVSAQMQGATLAVAQMHGAELSGVQMQGAILSSAQMQGAHLSGAQMQGAELSFAQMQGAGLSDAQMQGANLSSAQMQGAERLSAQMQGADLSLAQIQGAAFIDMYINEREIYVHIEDVFGDGTNQINPDLVPTGDDPWPDHWPTESLHWNDFNRAWRDWVAENHPDVLQYLPDYLRNA